MKRMLKYLKDVVPVVYRNDIETSRVMLTREGYRIEISLRQGFKLYHLDELVQHEFAHIVRGDLVAPQMDEDAKRWNIACDVFINAECCPSGDEMGLITPLYMLERFGIDYKQYTAPSLYEALKYRSGNDGNDKESDGGKDERKRKQQQQQQQQQQNERRSPDELVVEVDKTTAMLIHRRFITKLKLVETYGTWTVRTLFRELQKMRKEFATVRRVRTVDDGFVSFGTEKKAHASCALFVDVSGSCQRYLHIAIQVAKYFNDVAVVYLFGSDCVRYSHDVNYGALAPATRFEPIYETMKRNKYDRIILLSDFEFTSGDIEYGKVEKRIVKYHYATLEESDE